MIDALAFVWGVAEATVFFFVPDVFLTYVAIRSLRRSLRASVFATAGALIGGCLMFAFGATKPEAARHLLVSIPAIHERMVDDVGAQIERHGAVSVFLGPLRGIPYKIYAVEWGRRHRALLVFALVSIPARAIRFVLTAALTAGIARLLRGRLRERALVAVHIAAWTAFYAFYFFEMR